MLPDVYADGFENWLLGGVPAYWQFTSSGLGTVSEVAASTAAEGGSHLVFSPADTVSGDLSAGVGVDLSAFSLEPNLNLQFLARDESGSGAGQFFVELSDNGSNWVSVLSTDLPQVDTRFLVDVDEAASAAGIAIDATTYVRLRLNARTSPRVFVDDLRFTIGDLLGPQIETLHPDTLVAGDTPLDELQLTFSESVDPGSFDATDVTLLNPLGDPIAITSVIPEAGSTNRVFNVVFPASDVRGGYRLMVGPGVFDLAGNAMNQNGDSVNGDGYATTIQFAPTIWSPAQPEPELFVESFEDWSTAVPTYWSFETRFCRENHGCQQWCTARGNNPSICIPG